MKQYDSNFITFLSNYNAVVIKTSEEWFDFLNLMKTVGLQMNKYFDSFEKAKSVHNKDYVVIEYNNAKGFCFYEDIQKSTEWFGVEPFNLSDIMLNHKTVFVDYKNETTIVLNGFAYPTDESHALIEVEIPEVVDDVMVHIYSFKEV